jgi:hypothetical protein
MAAGVLHADRGRECGPPLSSLDQRHIQQARQHFRLLRPGHGMAPPHNEARHAADAEAMGAELVGTHRLDLLLPGRNAAGGALGAASRHFPLAATIRDSFNLIA